MGRNAQRRKTERGGSTGPPSRRRVAGLPRGARRPRTPDRPARGSVLLSFAVGLVVSALTVLLPIGELDVLWRGVIALGVVLLLAVALWIRYPRPVVRLVSAGSVVVLAVAGIWAYVATDTLRRLEAEVAGVCSDGMWLGRTATCYPAAVSYMNSHFDAFDPETWHGWDALPPRTAVGVPNLAAKAIPLQGVAIASAGRVLAVQDLGGQLLLQIGALRQADADRVDQERAAAAFASAEDRDEVLRPVSDAVFPQTVRAACNLTPRPFFRPRVGDVLAFTGIIAANGTVPQQGSTAALQTLYVYCSSAEILTADR